MRGARCAVRGARGAGLRTRPLKAKCAFVDDWTGGAVEDAAFGAIPFVKGETLVRMEAGSRELVQQFTAREKTLRLT